MTDPTDNLPESEHASAAPAELPAAREDDVDQSDEVDSADEADSADDADRDETSEDADEPEADEPEADEPEADEPEADEPDDVVESVEAEEAPKPAKAAKAAKPEVTVGTAASRHRMDAEVEVPAEKNWYILKVQSNREDSIADALRRRVKIEALDEFFDEIIVPTEKVTEFTKSGKKRVVKRKLYPGYLVVHMLINDETWFLVRETPGIGDFTGAGGKPVPMLPHEVAKIVAKQDSTVAEAPKLKINFKPGSRVKIIEGTFENFEGEVDSIDEKSGSVTVMINIFGRPTPVELEYWQAEAM